MSGSLSVLGHARRRSEGVLCVLFCFVLMCERGKELQARVIGIHLETKSAGGQFVLHFGELVACCSCSFVERTRVNWLRTVSVACTHIRRIRPRVLMAPHGFEPP
jgi:hypothetical protein